MSHAVHVTSAPQGATPNPDVWCNREIKFGRFHQYCTESLGVDFVATGMLCASVGGDDGMLVVILTVWGGAFLECRPLLPNCSTARGERASATGSRIRSDQRPKLLSLFGTAFVVGKGGL